MSVTIAMVNDSGENHWHRVVTDGEETITTACGEEYPRAVVADIRTVSYFTDVGAQKSRLDQKLNSDGRCPACDT